jgi:predicted dienelactone hydrolase
VLPRNAPTLANTLPHRPEYHLVPNAAHFAFLAPCSAAMKNHAPEICVDANGFDRTAFHKQLDEMALTFFQANVRSVPTGSTGARVSDKSTPQAAITP